MCSPCIGWRGISCCRWPRSPGLFERPTVAFRVPGALPRARVVGGVRVAAGPKELDALLDPWRDPAGSVVLTTGRDVVPAPGFTGRAAIVRERADALEFEVELSADGHLVLADTWDPGWKARLDGAPVELLRADVAFRAVAVPAGRHRVEMVYRPFVAITGLAVSALTAGLLLAWAGWSLRRPRLVPGAGESTAASGSLSQAG